MENVQVENADSDSENRPNFSRRRGPYRQYLNSETSNRVPRQTRMRWRDADVQTDHEESLAARENEVSNSYLIIALTFIILKPQMSFFGYLKIIHSSTGMNNY